MIDSSCHPGADRNPKRQFYRQHYYSFNSQMSGEQATVTPFCSFALRYKLRKLSVSRIRQLLVVQARLAEHEVI